MLTKSLAQEFGTQGIRVNAVAPGLIEVSKTNVTAAYRDQFTAMVPSGRTGTPADIAGVVSFLISPAADYVNGECIVVDGGFLTGRTLQRSKTS
jgi:3-oxoacyl-[acyl-carrier protein] reductase